MARNRVVVFPAWFNNPFLNIVYLAHQGRGHEMEPTTTVANLEPELQQAGRGDVLHVHWTAPVCQRAATEKRAWESLRRFQAIVDDFRSRGGSVVWTIHNRLPHELDHREPELELNQWLADTADVVHVMAPATAEVVAEDYTIPPDKVRVIPHPSYQGLYEVREGDRAAARHDLGVDPDRRTVLFFGQMRPYKGLDTLRDAANRLAGDPDAPVLLMAGVTPEGVEAEILERLDPRVDTVRHHGFVPDSDVATWFGAADVAVYPYRAILNSGSVHLSATFGVPAVLPGEPHLLDQFGDEGWVQFTDLDDQVGSLERILRDPATYQRPVEALRAFSERLSPWPVSSQYADMLADAAR